MYIYDYKNVVAGDTFQVRFRFLTGEPPVAVNLTGYTGNLTLKWGSTVKTLPLVLDSLGNISVDVTPDITKLFPVGKQVTYDVTLIDASSIALTKVYGMLSVLADLSLNS